MSFVLDNSIALAWCFEDERTRLILDLLDRLDAYTGTDEKPSEFPPPTSEEG